MTRAPPAVSIIICTRNRAAALPRCLDSVQRALDVASRVTAEIVLVDNGSTDETQEVVRRWCEAHSAAVDVVVEQRAGLAIARNAGVARARGQILAFTDDDCELAADYLAGLAEAFARSTRPTMIGGRVELGDPADLPFTIKLDAEPATYPPDAHPGGFLLGCNMAMSREAWDRIGAFDERFGAGAPFKSAEDTDYIYRAHLAGVDVRYEPALVVRHFHGRRSQDELIKLHHGYNVGNGALFAKFALRSPRLLKHFYWDLRDAVGELVGGPIFDPALGLTYRGKVKGNLAGAWLFVRRKVSGR